MKTTDDEAKDLLIGRLDIWHRKVGDRLELAELYNAKVADDSYEDKPIWGDMKTQEVFNIHVVPKRVVLRNIRQDDDTPYPESELKRLREYLKKKFSKEYICLMQMNSGDEFRVEIGIGQTDGRRYIVQSGTIVRIAKM